jgi:uncharacterized protein (TIGR03083 family)
MHTRLSDAAYLDALDRSTNQVGALAGKLDPALGVPSCPQWSVRDLLEHLGGVHTWARTVIAGGNPKDAKPPLKGDPIEWYDEQATQMLAAMRDVSPDQPCWTFRQDERRAGFWFRRQAHETEMHLLDLAMAAGVSDDYLPALAADAITETFDVMLPRLSRDKPVAVSAPILLNATDVGTSWLLRPSELPATLDYSIGAGAESADAAVHVSAPAAALLTGLWRRTPYEQWQVDGDRAVLDRLMSANVTP